MAQMRETPEALCLAYVKSFRILGKIYLSVVSSTRFPKLLKTNLVLVKNGY
jgi:hypothetical protein